MPEEPTTNEVLASLRHDIVLEAQDAANQNDRVTNTVLTRLANALTRNIERRTAQEAVGQPEVQTESISLETAAAKAASKRVN